MGYGFAEPELELVIGEHGICDTKCERARLGSATNLTAYDVCPLSVSWTEANGVSIILDELRVTDRGNQSQVANSLRTNTAQKTFDMCLCVRERVRACMGRQHKWHQLCVPSCS